MAVTRGCFGQISVGGNVLGELRAWELTETAEEIDVSIMGNCVKRYEAGPVEASGTFTCYMDDTDTAQGALTVGAEIAVLLYPGGVGTGLPSRSFSAKITEIPESADVDGVVERNYSYRATTTIDRTPQA